MAANDGERKAGSFRDTNAAILDRLRASRGPGESYSDVILRMAKEGHSARGRSPNEPRARPRRA